MKKSILIFILFCFFTITHTTKSQSNNVFTSYTGRFSINISGQKDGGGGNGTAGGIVFNWTRPEAKYEVGFYEKMGLPLALNGETFSYTDCVKQYFNRFSANGEKVYEKDINLSEFKGKEYKYKTKTAIFILRLFQVEDRIYKLVAEIPLKQESQEENVFQIFNSFQLLNKVNVTAEMKRRIDEATPKALPQSPVLPKPKSDIDDRGLKGKVKSVLTENAYYNLNFGLKPTLPFLFEEFDEKGSLLKSTEYNSYGDASIIKVYGYVAGKRVASWGSVKYEYDFDIGIPIDFPASAKSDNRFEESFTYKYLNGRLSEESNFFNNGIRHRHIKFQYLKSKKESLYFDSGTTPFLKMEEFLNEKGNAVKMIEHRKEGKKFVVENSYTFKYESFDEQGNWTKRIVLKDYGFGINLNFVPEYEEYRTISYY